MLKIFVSYNKVYQNFENRQNLMRTHKYNACFCRKPIGQTA